MAEVCILPSIILDELDCDWVYEVNFVLCHGHFSSYVVLLCTVSVTHTTQEQKDLFIF